MPRYFIEVSYKGTAYSGFQVQKNANSIQAEIENALSVFFKHGFSLTGSSRTDAGVHALQNYFHFDTDESLFANNSAFNEVPSVYNLNAILPLDIVIKRIFQVEENMHCRFDAVSRCYKYFIFREKNPFLQDRAFYYPYKIDMQLLNEASELVLLNKDFTSFSKRNTQVKHFICDIKKSVWIQENDMLVYKVESNRFLRGMVKGLVGTMLRVATHKISLEEFVGIIENKDCRKADFSVPSKGLFLIKVAYKSF
jgi:tRNA pseudouridine38-40 synthase